MAEGNQKTDRSLQTLTPERQKTDRSRRNASSHRRKARRARRRRRIAAIVTILTLSVALIGLGLWLLPGNRPGVVGQAYPMEYEAQIRARAAENGLDPALPAAVILAESSYRPEAVSEANAQGLMQLLPDTAQWISEKFDEVYAEGCLFEPEVNIKYGCWYLGYLMKRFDGDVTKAVAAYHAGQGRVDEWLADPACSPDGVTLSTIPSDATRTYVTRVLKYYEKYQALYAQAA